MDGDGLFFLLLFSIYGRFSQELYRFSFTTSFLFIVSSVNFQFSLLSNLKRDIERKIETGNLKTFMKKKKNQHFTPNF